MGVLIMKKLTWLETSKSIFSNKHTINLTFEVDSHDELVELLGDMDFKKLQK